ncbi:MAG: hypothetical protein OXB92_07865 [Acidimicrobiaceae bacterium]|nr:hypothetical protein [Acidimicrobiia bacterium]MCY4493754.1 hypothetical protein [Acidimicrobiaceae bacterium]
MSSFKQHLAGLAVAGQEAAAYEFCAKKTEDVAHDLWTKMLTVQIAQAEAAAEAGVDWSVIARLQTVARDGAVAALGASKPCRWRQSQAEASGAAALRVERVEVERLGRTVVKQAAELAELHRKTGSR